MDSKIKQISKRARSEDAIYCLRTSLFFNEDDGLTAMGIKGFADGQEHVEAARDAARLLHEVLGHAQMAQYARKIGRGALDLSLYFHERAGAHCILTLSEDFPQDEATKLAAINLAMAAIWYIMALSPLCQNYNLMITLNSARRAITLDNRSPDDQIVDDMLSGLDIF